jgi:protein ImuB
LRRESQARCPELIVAARNEAAEARLFEPIVVALESIAPGVEITRPGLAAIGAQGPTRYFGGEPGVLRELSRAVVREVAGVEVDLSIGVADGAFAAVQAARRALIVAPGDSPAFLAPLPIDSLDPSGDTEVAALIDLLRRLGLITLGQFAALPPRDVLARFGPAGAWAHRQAGGHDDRPLSARRPPVEFSAEVDFEPALERVDAIAFSSRELSERFIGDLAAHGLACTCLELQASTENGEETVRRWRHSGVLRSTDVLDRIRWQLSGWRPSRGVVRLRLIPLETVPVGAHQRALWGGSGDEDERAHRALARVQTLLGHGSVLAPVLDGGRDPAQRTRLVPWGDEAVPLHSPQHPWPGRLPAPADPGARRGRAPGAGDRPGGGAGRARPIGFAGSSPRPHRVLGRAVAGR